MSTKVSYKRGESDTRPWGKWEVIDVGDSYIVKRIIVNPGQILSLQYHNYRDEHWVIVKGVATVTLDDEVLRMAANESVFISSGVRHRIANETDDVVEFIEVQTGSVLSEDDIVRIEDNYGRVD